MIYDNNTNETINKTLQDLKDINDTLNKTINDVDAMMGDYDRKILRSIRNKNIETIQLIQKMELTEAI